MPARAKAQDSSWECPKCGSSNPIDFSMVRECEDYHTTCWSCTIKVDVYVPPQKTPGPFTRDGILVDQIYGILENCKYWDFHCPACRVRNKWPPLPGRLEKTHQEVVIQCQKCGRNLKITGEW